MSEKIPPNPEEIMARKARRSFIVGGTAALAGIGSFAWLRSRSDELGIPWPLRRVHEANDRIGQTLNSPMKLARTFPAYRAEEPRVNGQIGLLKKVDADLWQIEIRHENRDAAPIIQKIVDLRNLPRKEMTTELKCVEGWSTIVTWGGYAFADWLREFGFGTLDGKPFKGGMNLARLLPYVYVATPDDGYYSSLDIASMVHPQTLLCDTMNGEPLTPGHGAPLRLVTTLKYGIKLVKQVGKIHFRQTKPADYWAERGYDWYAGH